MALSILVSLADYYKDEKFLQEQFNSAVENRFFALKRELLNKINVLESLQALYISTQDLERSELLDRNKFRDFANHILKHDASLQALEWTPRVPDSKRKSYESAARGDGEAVFDDENRFLYLAGLGQDITERKLTEKKIRTLNEELEDKVRERTQQLLDTQEKLIRKEKLALLGQVVGSVGHELRNPLAVMNNAVYFLQTVLADADESTREYLDIIKTEIDDAERIVADLLDSVRTKAPQPAVIDVGELIDQTMRTLTLPATMTITLDLPKSLSAIWVDAGQIQQVFRNLISNGVEAMPEGGTLAINAVENLPEGTVSVSVNDTGCGIPPEVQAQLFEPLITTKAHGIGLGLVVVKNLTEANGGTVTVKSLLGQGTTFTVVLPKGATA